MTTLASKVEEEKDRRGHTGQPAPGTPGRRALGALTVGSLVAVAIYLPLSRGWTPGLLSLALLAGLLVAAPSAPDLPRRLAVNGSVLIGWAPLAWWVRWPSYVNHSVLLVALGWAGLVVMVLWAPDRAQALARLRPETRRIDVVIPAGAVLALAAMSRWAFAGTPRDALRVLLPGADNYPHFDMFAAIRTHGAALNVLGPSPDGSRWAYYNYPQGFHGLAAALSELMAPDVGTGPAMLVSYTQAVALIVGLGVVVLTAAVLSVSGLRSRPLLVLPAVVVTWAGFLWEPGQKAIVDGFANFWLGAAAAGTALLIGVAARRYLPLPEVVAVGGLFVACANTWTPLLLFALPGGLALLAGRRAALREPDYRRRVVGTALVLAGCAAAVGAVGLLLARTVPIGYVVTTTTGGLHGTSPIPTLLLLVVAVYSCLSYPAWQRRVPTAGLPDPGRVRVVALAPMLGLVVLTAFLVAQLELIHTTAYYFLKYTIGFELVMAAFAPALCATVVATAAPAVRPRWGLAASALAVVLATQAFGWFPNGTMPLFSRSGDGTAGLAAPLSVSGVADGVLKAAAGTRPSETMKVEYFPLGRSSALNPFYGDAWFHAVQHSLSERVFERYGAWRTGSEGLDSAASLIGPVLESEPDVQVVVDPRYVAPLRARLGSPELARRLVGWG